MRFLFTAAPEIGHITPLLGVAVAARAAGHDVLVATHPSRHRLIADAGLEPISAGMATADVDRERRRRWPETASQPATEWGVRMWVHIAAVAMARDVAKVIDKWDPDVVVHEEGDYGTPPAASAAGVPWVTFAWGAPLRSIDELETLDAEVSAAGLWPADGLAVSRFGGFSAHSLINPCPVFLQRSTIEWPEHWRVRPNVLGEDSPDGQMGSRRCCYIGFGTVPAFANAALDIEVAARAAGAAGLAVVATVSDPELAKGLTHLGVDVRSFVSLPQLLPSCAIVITHGGAGTTLAALRYGAPVVAVPQGSPSQHRMAIAIEQAGVGKLAAGPDDLPDAVKAVVGDDRFTTAASQAAEDLAMMPDPATVVDKLVGVASR